MADDNVLKVQIQLDDGTVAQGFAKIQREGESAFSRIGEVAAGVLASQAITSALGTIRGVFDQAIDSAANYGVEVQKLNGNLALSGRYSNQASKEFTDLADSIQRTTAFSDDQVLSIAALGSNFTHSNEQTKKLTQATLDFAAATGKDANEAAQQLSLTLQGNIGRLGRYFPQLKEFTESQLEAGAAVDFLASRFAGAAVAQSNTYAASISQLKNAYDDVLKSLGQLITESPTVVATIKFIADEFLRLSDAINGLSKGDDVFKNLARSVANFAETAATTIIPAVETLGYAFSNVLRTAVASGEIFIGLYLRQLDLLKDGVANAKEVISRLGTAAPTPISDALLGSVQRYQAVLDAVVLTQKAFKNQVQSETSVLAGSITSIFDQLQSVPLSFSDIMNTFAQSYQLAIDKIVETTREGLGQAATQAFQGFSNAVSSGFAAIGKALVKGQNVFQAFAGALLSGLGQAAIQLGSFYLLLGLARAFSSYGLDATAFQLIGIGGALAVLGGTLSAFGEGVTGTSNPATSVNTGGGSAIDTSASTSASTANTISQTQSAGVTVNIQGDVLDSRETGLRIVDLINDSFSQSGAKVAYT